MCSRDRPARAHPALGRREHIVLPIVVRGARAALGSGVGYAVNSFHRPDNVPGSVLPLDRILAFRLRLAEATGVK
jgi:hypothetical protein